MSASELPRATSCMRLSFVALAALGLGAVPDDERAPIELVAGEHHYVWQTDWPALPGGARFGRTHGAIAFDSDGHVVVNTDTRFSFLVLEPTGELVRTFGEEFGSGVHGMLVTVEDDRDVVYFAHTPKGQVVSMTLEGEVLWRTGAPAASGLYEDPGAFRPTAVALAPDGRLFVADGYGTGWIHLYDAERQYVRSFGGPGTEPGRFRTPHGLLIDTRAAVPTLLVADRENGRLQRFSLDGEHLEVLDAELRRPCSIAQRGDELVVADLEGRVTLLGPDSKVIGHLGANPDPELRGTFDVALEDQAPGEFTAPHFATWDARGDLYVMDWNRFGRVTKLARR